MASAPPEYKGYLLKKGDKGITKSYRKRYFVLRSNKLIYYASPEDKEALGTISLNKASGIHKSSQPSNKKDAQCAFQIDTGIRIYYLLAETEDSCKQWIDMLNNSKKYYLNTNTDSKSLAIPIRDEDEDDEEEQQSLPLSSSLGNTNTPGKKFSTASDDSTADSTNEIKFNSDQDELQYLRDYKKKMQIQIKAFTKKLGEVKGLADQFQEKGNQLKRAEANVEQLEKKNRELEKELAELKAKSVAKDKGVNTKEHKSKDIASNYLLMENEENETKKKTSGNNICANCIVQ